MTTTLTEKPPLYSSYANSPTRQRRELNHQTLVAKRKQSSPNKLRRSKTYDASYEDFTDPSSDKDIISAEENKKKSLSTEINSNNNRPNSLEVTMSNNLSPYNEREQSSTNCLSRRRNTEQIPSTSKKRRCICREHHTGLNSCGCERRRHTVSPGISEKEIMENETKLMVLEFLSALSPEQLTARNISRENSKETDREICVSELVEDHSIQREGSNKSIKWKTVTIGEAERKRLMEQLREHAAQEDKIIGKKLNRSSSDLTADQYTAMRNKIREMQIPIKNWLHENLHKEIVDFEIDRLKPSSSSSSSSSRTSPKKSLRQKCPPPTSVGNMGMSIAIPRRSIQVHHLDTIACTPETYAVNRLEEISQEIMKDYPEMLNKAIDDLLAPLASDESITYNRFSKVAKSVYDNGVSGTVWSRIGLVLYMVKETMILGNLNDTQLELLVEHSTKFFTENASEYIEEEGGWAASVYASDLYDISSNDESLEMHEERVNRKISREKMRESSLKEKVTQTVNNWTPYGMAALAVGLGLAYSYLKT